MKIVREPHIAPKIVVVDGLPGCGKTMLSPIVGALPRVQLIQYPYEIEYVCSLQFLKRMESDAAQALIRMFTDLLLYNVMQSRETNFRPSDISSVFRSARPWQYFKRLFQKGDEAVLPRIEREKPILHLTTHFLLPFAAPMFEALGDRIALIEVVRHPLYMVRQQSLYQDRFGTDPRDFTIWFDYEGKAVPYFAHGWEEIFLKANAVERSIHIMRHLSRRILESERSGVLVIPFEPFVLNPWPYLGKMEAMLETKSDRTTLRMLQRQKVPRKKIADGRALKIYRTYGWKEGRKGAGEREELKERRAFAAAHASKEAMEILDELSRDYEERYWHVPQ